MNTFTKSERLCSKRLFEALAGSDFAFVKYPFRVVAKRSAVLGEYPARVAVSVGKKRFKQAVKRNRVKRQTREAYRLNKAPFYDALPLGQTWDVLFIYLDRQLPEYSRIEKSVRASLHKILQHAAGEQIS